MRRGARFLNLRWPGRTAAVGAFLSLVLFAGGSAGDAQAATSDTLDGVVQIIAHARKRFKKTAKPMQPKTA